MTPSLHSAGCLRRYRSGSGHSKVASVAVFPAWCAMAGAPTVGCGGCDTGGQNFSPSDGAVDEGGTRDGGLRDRQSDAPGTEDLPDPSERPEPAYHRVAPVDCPLDRPTTGLEWSFGECEPAPIEGGCQNHDDCTEGANGRCTPFQLAGCRCSYDECFSDDDCGTDEACVCGDRSRLEGHRCVPANCRTDNDCGEGHWCAASLPCANGWVWNLYCTTPEDACVAASPCDELGEAQCLSIEGKPWTCETRYNCGDG